MDEELIKKLDELILIFENSKEIQKINTLKKEIYENKEIKEKIEEFNLIRNDCYNSKYLDLKREILNIETIKEYKKIENDLFLLTLEINKRLNSIIDKKGCTNENN